MRESHPRPGPTDLVIASGWLFILLASFPQTAVAVVTTFTNSSQITITDNSKATPYPSTIMVNVPGDTTTKIRVNLRLLSHSFPRDVDILLVGPTGARSILMSDAGGSSPAVESGIGFEASAPTAIPENGPLPGFQEFQLYRPANYGSPIADVFPAPGPGSLSDAPADLSVFNGLNPNGEWKLYVVDDDASSSGAILSGWEIIVTHPESRVVNATDDTDDGTCDAAHCSLREAIRTAPEAVFDEAVITFSPLFDSPQTITLAYSGTRNPLIVAKLLTIRGPGARLLTVSGGGKQPVFVFATPPGFPTLSMTLSGMSITGGHEEMLFSPFGGGVTVGNVNLTISECHIFENRGIQGGGITNRGILTVLRSTISRNYAGLDGSGIFSGARLEDPPDTPPGELHILDSTISGNRGGGSSVDASSPTTITSSTIVVEEPATEQAVLTQSVRTLTGYPVTVTNTIIAGSRTNSAPDVASLINITSGGHNLIGIPGNPPNFEEPGDITGTPQSPLDPQLAPLAYHGGPTPTHAFASFSSPAVDSGTSAGRPTDQRGLPRLFDNPGVPTAEASDGTDIGAFEQRGTWIVTNTDDFTGGSCLAECSLRNAIAVAETNDSIFFTPFFGRPQTLLLGGTALSIDKNLVINGPGADLLTVSGNMQSAVFDVGPNVSLALNGLTISGGNGSGIRSQGTLTLTGCHVTGNTAVFGGGIHNLGGRLALAQSTVSNNTALGSDPAGTGGGIDSDVGALLVTDSTISGNQATGAAGGNYAGGIWTQSARVISSTITNNTASGPGSAGGLHRQSGRAGVFVQNSIIARNSASSPDVTSIGDTGIASGGSNLIGNSGAIAFSDTDQAGTTAAPVDPKLGPLADNGGTTPTHALLLSGPALDKGNDLFSSTDQRGFARAVDNPDVANPVDRFTDIGAVEQGLGPRVTLTTDSDDGVCDASCSLREAIAVANPGDVIRFDDLAYTGVIRLTLGELVIDKNLTITAADEGVDLTVSGAHQSRVFRIASGALVTLSGLTIADGDTVGNGGGILNSGNLTLSDCHVVGNSAEAGGGIFNNSSGNLTLERTTVSNNTATGTVETGGGIASLGALSVTNSTISGNRVLQADNSAGGIWLQTFETASMPILNSTITANSAVGSDSAGGLRRQFLGTFALRNTIVAANLNNAVVPDVSSAFAGGINSGGFNLIGNPGTVPLIASDLSGTSAAPLDPGLGPLQHNGGRTPTHALLLTSPAVDQGNILTTSVDQRNLGRPFDAAGIAAAADGSDIGAVEIRPTVVTNAGSDGAGSLVNVIGDAPDQSDIFFDPDFFAVERTISSPGGGFYLNKSLRIFGPGADLLTISGSKDSTVFHVSNPSVTPDVTLSGLRISAPGTPGGLFPEARRGGAIQMFDSRLTVSECEIVGNTGVLAGGIYATGARGSVTLQNSLVADNTAIPSAFPGASALAGGIRHDMPLTLVNSTVSGNHATGTDGAGGISMAGSSHFATILNSTITDNSASGTGSVGGIRHGSEGTTLTVRNTIIAANGSGPDVVSTQTDTMLRTHVVSDGYNLIGNSGTVDFNGPADQSGMSDSPIDPLLGPLDDNGGTTRTHAPLAGSLALDAGHRSRSFSDQRLLPRPVDNFDIANAIGGDGADIGAYESQDPGQPPPTATATPTSPAAEPTPGGACCAAHDGPGCDASVCQACVCDTRIGCCRGTWDEICVMIAAECNAVCACLPITPTSTPTPGGACCSAHGGPGCDDQACQACVCNNDAFCCGVQWDETCAGQAIGSVVIGGGSCASICACQGSPTVTPTPPAATPTSTVASTQPPTATGTQTGSPAATPTQTTVMSTPTPGGDCCSGHGGPGCDEEICQACVCGVDNACCATQWTTQCASTARGVCASICACPNVTVTPTTTPTRNPSAPTATGTPTATPPLGSTVSPTPSACAGDCDASGMVTIDELIRGVRIALGSLPVDQCLAMDSDHNGVVLINELVAAVNVALGVCP